MTTGATGQLGLALPVQGELSGTWGDTVNNGITQYTNIAIAGTLTLTGDGAVTLANTTGDASASNITSTLAGAGTVTAQFAIVRVSGTTTTKVVTGPSYSKTYVVDNASSFAVTFKASGQTGVSIAAAEKVTVVFNGTDYIKLAGTIANAAGSNTQIQFNNGGLFGASANLTWDGTTLSSTQVNITGQGTLRLQDTTGGEYVGLRSPSALGASYTLTFPADDGTSGQALITDGSGVLSWSTAASGDVYGPASSTDNAVARFDSTTGKLLQNSVVLIGDTGAVTGVTDLTASGSVTLSGGTANGVAYLNGSKVLTSGSALTFDGTNFSLPTLVTSGTANIGANLYLTANALYYHAKTTGGTNVRMLGINAGNTAYVGPIDSGPNDTILNASASSANIQFYATGSEAMRLTSTGLGIGTSSPAAKLDVGGAFVDSVPATYGGTIRIASSTQTTVQGIGGIEMPVAGDGYSYKIQQISNSGANLVFASRAASATWTERMRLDSSGNLGLGVTPSAWGSTWKAIQVGMGGSIFARTADQNRIGITANAFFDTAFKYIGTGQATFYDQDDGNHYWYNAPSGTAGNAITFSQAMTLTANGELMVGTTTATGKASIAGAITATASSALVNPSVGVFGLYTGGAIPNTYVQMPSGGSIDFWKADTGVAARIDSSGNLLVGTTSSAGGYKLKVIGDSSSNTGFLFDKSASSTGTALEIDVGSSNTTQKALIVYSGSAGADRLYIYSNGNVVNTNNSYGAISDEKLKENIVDASPKLADLMQVKVRNYNLIGDSTKQLGVVAQELETVFPAMVDETTDRDAEGNDLGTTTKQVKYSVFVPMLIKAIQEQQAIINQFKARLDAANL